MCRPILSHVSLIEHLARRVARNPGPPLVTWYGRGPDGVADARTELSAATFANWVDKIANLLADEIDLADGDTAAMPVLQQHPGHWQSLATVLAVWQRGATVTVGVPGGDATIVGPDSPAGAGWTAALSLHPLGLGLRDQLVDGVVDLCPEALSQPDAHDEGYLDLEAEAWQEEGFDQTHASLLEVMPEPERRLVDLTNWSGSAWPVIEAAVIAPILGGGSAVVVDAGDVAALAAAEKATTIVQL